MILFILLFGLSLRVLSFKLILGAEEERRTNTSQGAMSFHSATMLSAVSGGLKLGKALSYRELNDGELKHTLDEVSTYRGNRIKVEIAGQLEEGTAAIPEFSGEAGAMMMVIEKLEKSGMRQLDHLLPDNAVLKRLQGAVLNFLALVGGFPTQVVADDGKRKKSCAEKGRQRIETYVASQQNAFVEAAREGTINGARLQGRDLHTSKKPNMGEALARSSFKEDFEIEATRWLSTLEHANEKIIEMMQRDSITVIETLSALIRSEILSIFKLGTSDESTFNTALGKKQKIHVAEAYQALKEASSEDGANSMIAFVHWLDRSRGVERVLIEVFERKGLFEIDLLTRDMCYIGMALGGFVLDLIGKEKKWQGPELTDAKSKKKYSLAQFLYSSIQSSVGNLMGDVSLSFRYEGYFNMVEASRSNNQARKLHTYSQAMKCYGGSTAANLRGLQISQPAFDSGETMSRINGLFQVTEMWYQLDRLLAEDFGATYERQFSPEVSIGNRLFLMRMLAGFRWMKGSLWGLTDSLRRIPKALLELEKLSSEDDVIEKKELADQLQLKQYLLAGLRGAPVSDPYRQYPGFLAGITLLEYFDELTQILHLAKQKVAIIFNNPGVASEEMELGVREVGFITDLLRKFLDVHGKPGLWEKGIDVSLDGDHADTKSLDMAAAFLMKFSSQGAWEPEDGSFDVKMVPDPENKMTMKRGLVPEQDENNFLYQTIAKTKIYECAIKALELLLRKLTGKETPMWTTNLDEIRKSLDDKSLVSQEEPPWKTVWNLAGLAKPFKDSANHSRKEEAWLSMRYVDELRKFHAEESENAVHDMIFLQNEASNSIARSWRNALKDLGETLGDISLI